MEASHLAVKTDLQRRNSGDDVAAAALFRQLTGPAPARSPLPRDGMTAAEEEGSRRSAEESRPQRRSRKQEAQMPVAGSAGWR